MASHLFSSVSSRRTCGSFKWMFRPKEPFPPGVTAYQRRGKRIMPPPYREENLVEKAMKRIPGVNDCPNACLCSQKIEITFKNVRLLSQFTSQQTGCILPRTITKVCLRKQRAIAKEIKKSRAMGFLPYIESLPEYRSDPKLFNRSRARIEMYSQIHQNREITRTKKFQFYSLRE